VTPEELRKLGDIAHKIFIYGLMGIVAYAVMLFLSFSTVGMFFAYTVRDHPDTYLIPTFIGSFAIPAVIAAGRYGLPKLNRYVLTRRRERHTHDV
jgi:hypothetical protein